MDEKPIKVIFIGIGPIGKSIIKTVSSRSSLQIVGAFDIDKTIIGRDLGEICQIQKLNVSIRHIDELEKSRAQVAIVTTVSSVEKLWPLLKRCICGGFNVVSTCEELAYPFHSHADLAKEIDTLAKYHNVSVLGTGINPGFLMDALPVLLSCVSRRVDSIRIERFQDSSKRRIPFQKKIGVGLSVAEFMKERDSGRLRHVGFSESIYMIADAFGWKLDSVEETVEPVFDVEGNLSNEVPIRPGHCCGMIQYGFGYSKGKRVITLELQAYKDHADPKDSIIINGEPTINSTIAGGVHGDVSTSAIITNAIYSITKARSGLRTMIDITIPHWKE